MKKAQKYFDKAPKSTQNKINHALLELSSAFPNVMACQHVEKMQGSDLYYRYRIGDYRILFSPREDTLYIIDIGPRGDIYK